MKSSLFIIASQSLAIKTIRNMEPNSLSDEQKNPRDIMYKADNRNSTL